MSDDTQQAIDEHMIKFKGRSSMKQYGKHKPISSGDLSSGSDAPVKRDICRKWTCTLERSSKLTQKLNDTYCTLFFDNFFNSPSPVEKLYQRGIYGIGTIRKDRKHMPSMVPDKAMKDHEFQYSDKAISCKWFDNRAVHLLGSNVEGFDAVSVVSRR